MIYAEAKNWKGVCWETTPAITWTVNLKHFRKSTSTTVGIKRKSSPARHVAYAYEEPITLGFPFQWFNPLRNGLWLYGTYGVGATVTDRLACSPPTKANRVRTPAGPIPDFRMWESCWAMPLVGGSSWGSPVSSIPPFRRWFILTPIHPHRLSSQRC
ncbi:hypothetical protein PR048_008678 [Dryococelus australis]|uniref:Uncharacterized protein n=1 Tax=Dryococelus australis TaxID=614101 RepID=A0ABQ9HXT6_9NEOP|nr:hypothetical protein PR048_008678 [Dryococelus australis]